MKLNRAVILLAMGSMVCWLLVFGLGLLVPSQPYRDQLSKDFDWLVLAKAVIVFTPTNVALLAMLSGFLGGCSSLLLYAEVEPANSPGSSSPSLSESASMSGHSPVDEERHAFLTENPVSSALRGFVVYLTFLAGTVLGSNQPFVITTQDQYCRMAGTVAVLAFVMGYDPTVFKQFISVLPERRRARPCGVAGISSTVHTNSVLLCFMEQLGELNPTALV